MMKALSQHIAERAREALVKGWKALDLGGQFPAAFDADYYRSQLALIGIVDAEPDLLTFYKQNAEARIVSPNALFDETYYRKCYADVTAAIRAGDILSGFAHFVRHGIKEGRFPNPEFEVEIENNAATAFIASDKAFDEKFYLNEYSIARQFIRHIPILSPLQFFNVYGRRMGHIPRPDHRRLPFSTSAYLAQHPALKKHRAEDLELMAPHFDHNYYQKMYGDELGSMQPFAHYLSLGLHQRKSPNDWFDETFYRTFYPDVEREIAQGKMSSGFEHYLRSGRREGRLPSFDLTGCLDHAFPGVTKPVALTNFLDLERRVTPHPYRVAEGATQTVWFLIPRINPDIFFGGYASVLSLMETFLRTGYTIGLFLYEDRREAFSYYCYRRPRSMLAEQRDNIRVFSAFDRELFVFGRNDIFIAYSAWQALWADAYAQHTRTGSFAFLVQEYEPVFHSHDSVRFLVDMAYKLPHVALFNSAPLQKFFRDQRLGIFEHDPNSDRFLTFEHVLTQVGPPSRRELRARKARKLLIYARPEAHAARNLLEICLIALRKAIAANVFRQRYEFIGIGALSGPQFVDLGMGRALEILPKVDPDAYAKLLQGTDIGLSLMYAPHPSLIPFEMVNAGAVVITNTFSNRDHASLKARSARLVPVDLTIDSIVSGFQRAVRLAEDFDLRTNTAHSVPSAASWADVFDASFIESLLGKLSATTRSTAPRLP
ncbi:MAG: hypothetical protein K2X43_12985 [Hyphomonadaceae bacterium]|jgi:hypothetical protein|nr:hypothetical protein [Hyphomonadaceae bacterium]